MNTNLKINSFMTVIILCLCFVFQMPAKAENTFKTQFPYLPLRFIDKSALAEPDLKAIEKRHFGRRRIPTAKNAIAKESTHAFTVGESTLANQLLGLGGGDTFQVRITDSGSNTFDLNATISATDIKRTPVLIKVTDPVPSGASVGIGMLTLLVNAADVGNLDIVLVSLTNNNLDPNAQSLDDVIAIRSEFNTVYDKIKVVISGSNFFGRKIPGSGRLFMEKDVRHVAVNLLPRDHTYRIATKVLQGNTVLFTDFTLMKNSKGKNRVAVICTPYGINYEDITIP